MAPLAGLALWSAAILLCAAQAHAFTLTVKANGGCTGFQYTIKKNQYTYNETLGNFTFLAKGCTNADLRVSKFYIPGSCANTRSNNLNFKSLSPSSFNCDRVQGFDADTCNKVLDQAPTNAIVSNITTGEFIDKDSICWPADVGYVFVKNDCKVAKGDARVAVDVKLSDYDGSGCDIVKLPFGNGVGLSPGVIVGIVVAIVVVVVVLALLIWCCCCQIRRGRA